jgi:hypothetical protein
VSDNPHREARRLLAEVEAECLNAQLAVRTEESVALEREATQAELPQQAEVCDELGNVLPPDIAAVFAQAHDIDGLIHQVSQLKRQINSLRERSIGVYINFGEIGAALDSVRTMLQMARPYALCHRCGGDRCKVCEQQGWMCVDRWKVTGGKYQPARAGAGPDASNN